MKKKINSYSWIHELNRAALDAKCISDIKIQNLNESGEFTARQHGISRNTLDPETLSSAAYRASASKKRPKGNRINKGYEGRDTGAPQSGGERIEFPREIESAKDFAKNLISQHQEAHNSGNMGSVERHGELLMQFLQHSRQNEHLNTVADAVKNYIGRYQLKRAQGEIEAATPEKWFAQRGMRTLPPGPRSSSMNQFLGSMNRINTTGSNQY